VDKVNPERYRTGVEREATDTAIFCARIHQDHRGRPTAEAAAVDLEFTRSGDHLEVTVRAPYHDDPAPPGAAGPTWELWNYEVVELFFVGDDARYLEVELSPHGHHLVLQLEGVRQIKERLLPLDFNAEIQDHGSGARWVGRARLPLAWLARPLRRFNAFAIHGQAPERIHMAQYALPGDQPDFHQIERFPAIAPALAALVNPARNATLTIGDPDEALQPDGTEDRSR